MFVKHNYIYFSEEQKQEPFDDFFNNTNNKNTLLF